MSRLRVFVDADVIFAGAASPSTHGASHITRHYFPTGTAIKVLHPGDLILTIRQTLGQS